MWDVWRSKEKCLLLTNSSKTTNSPTQKCLKWSFLWVPDLTDETKHFYTYDYLPLGQPQIRRPDITSTILSNSPFLLLLLLHTLTWIWDLKPRCSGEDSLASICSGVEAVLVHLRRKNVGDSENETQQPWNQDGHDDLREEKHSSDFHIKRQSETKNTFHQL